MSSTIAFLSGSVMNYRWSQIADAGMIMFLVVAVKEITTEPPCILDAAKSSWKERLILQCLEVAFWEWIVVADVRATMRFCDSQVSHQESHAL